MPSAAAAQAHPHVWITATSELIYAPDGSVTGVRHAWTFDDMFSTYALQGIETKTKGAYSREELAPLAQTNVESLKEFGFFTFAKADGKKQKFQEPVDYFLEYKDAALTLHFTLPLKTPVKPQELVLEVFDPDFFIDFKFADKDPVRLVGAPAACQMTFQRPSDGAANAQKIGEQNFLNGDNSNYRRDVRQQDHGGVPVRPELRLRSCARPGDLASARCAGRSDARRCRACCCWRRRRSAARARAAPSRRRRHRRMAAGKAIGILSPDVLDHPRREVRRLGGLDAAGDLVCLRHFSRRRPRPWQGGDLVLSRRQPETARRGIVLSFASALMQSLVAVVIVGICAWLLNATAKTMCGAEKAIEIASYALIAAFGVRLVWTKGGGFIRALRRAATGAGDGGRRASHRS